MYSPYAHVENQSLPEPRRGEGAKIGLYRNYAEDLCIKTGLEANLLSIIDNLDMTTNGRSTFQWDNANHLIQTIFPDGEGVSYTYDTLGRRITRTTFNAQGQGQNTSPSPSPTKAPPTCTSTTPTALVALTDSTGAVKARYEYDEWGRIFALYNETSRVHPAQYVNRLNETLNCHLNERSPPEI